MTMKTLLRFVSAAALALLLSPASAPAQRVPLHVPFFGAQPVVTGPVDARFFGTYCQPKAQKFCKSIPVLPDPCSTVSDLKINLDHLVTSDGAVLSGGGRFRLDGKAGTVALAGSVAGLGRARFMASVPGLGMQTGDATLDSRGLELHATAQGRTLILRKDACGNNAPQVTLTTVGGPEFRFGETVLLVAQIVDEDTTFPPGRIVFTSAHQGGIIPGVPTAGGRSLFTSALRPGLHHVTVAVTDSGGLTGTGILDVRIVDHPPETPVIFLPAEGATLAAGAPVLLQGHADDPDTGFLPDSALAWSAQFVSGGPFVPLGTGSELVQSFAAPADPVRLRLTATDPSGGGTSQVERTVRVLAGSGDAPPLVAIREPDRLSVNGSIVRGYFPTDTAHFVASAFDLEDSPGDLQLRWTFTALTGPDGTPDPSPSIPNPAPVTGSLTADVPFPVTATTFYRVTFEATDSAGNTSTDSVEIFVNSSVIL
jgi:hypothetical protein